MARITYCRFSCFCDFLPRDAMRKRGLCSRSVCLSVTFVYYIQTAEDIVKRLSRPGSPIILVYWPNSKGNPFRGGRAQNTRGGKNLRFSTEIAVYLGNGTRKAQGCYGTLKGSHRWRFDLSVPMTLSDLERRDARGQIFRRISLITLVPFYL